MAQGSVTLQSAKSTGASHGARHIRDAVMHDVFFDISRIAMGCRPTCFHTTALIDRHVNESHFQASSV